MGITFTIIAAIIIAGSVAAMSLRNLVHCALAITATFAGLAALYLQLGAQFVGLAQILVYIGAVSILVVFAILLTRGGQAPEQRIFVAAWPTGIAIALFLLSVLVWAVTKSSVVHRELPEQPKVTVRQIGDALMNKYVLPLEVIGLLLTAALIGAVIIAMQDKEEKK